MNNLKEFDNYIVQLVESMRESAEMSDPDDISELDNELLPEEFNIFTEIEEPYHGTTKPLGEITGIQPTMFPPLFKLNDAHATFLTGEMLRLLKAYSIYPDFPKELPDHIKYRLLREIWNEKVLYIKQGELHLVFCNYIPDQCPFPGKYCHCRKSE